MKNIIIVVFVAVTLIGCGSGRITTLEKDQNEAIVVGRLTITNDGEDISNKSNILFDERTWATYAVWPDDNNYIYLKLPIGKHFIAFLQHSGYNKNFPDDYAVIELPESKIYYIGDLTIILHLSESDEAKTGIAGAVEDINKEVEKIPIDVSDNYDTTIKYFNQKFNNTVIIEKSLLQLNKYEYNLTSFSARPFNP